MRCDGRLISSRKNDHYGLFSSYLQDELLFAMHEKRVFFTFAHCLIHCKKLRRRKQYSFFRRKHTLVPLQSDETKFDAPIINPSRVNESDLTLPKSYDVNENYFDFGTEESIISKNMPRGTPLQSIILLNFVAIIWGTQHAVIKSVVDDSIIGLDNDFWKLIEHNIVEPKYFEPLNEIIINSRSPGDTKISGEQAAAFFTLSRFGLAAVLASPYTPGLSLLWKRIKENLSLYTTKDKLNENGSASTENRQLQYQGSTSWINEIVITENLQENTVLEKENESIGLAWRYGIELGLYMFLGYAFQAIGLQTTTASRSGLLLYLNVKLVPLFSFMIYGKVIQTSTWLSALVAFGGTALLSLDSASGNDNYNNRFSSMSLNEGDLWSIAAAAASALFILRMEVASKAVPKSSELNAASLWSVMFLAFLWTVGIYWVGLNNSVVELGGIESSRTDVDLIYQVFQQAFSTIYANPLQLIYLSGITTALANYIQSKAQKDVTAERASIIYAMDPIYGALFSNLLLGESLGRLGWVGAGLIFLSAAGNTVWNIGSVDQNETEEIVQIDVKENTLK